MLVVYSNDLGTDTGGSSFIDSMALVWWARPFCIYVTEAEESGEIQNAEVVQQKI